MTKYGVPEWLCAIPLFVVDGMLLGYLESLHQDSHI